MYIVIPVDPRDDISFEGWVDCPVSPQSFTSLVPKSCCLRLSSPAIHGGDISILCQSRLPTGCNRQQGFPRLAVESGRQSIYEHDKHVERKCSFLIPQSVQICSAIR